MSMKLTSDDLLNISNMLREADCFAVEIKMFALAGHDIYLRKEEKGHVVIGITDKQQDAPKGLNTR